MFFDTSQVASPSSICKICEQESKLAGVVDFSKCGLDHLSGQKVTPYSGIPIYYYCCESCGLTFTTAMDQWSQKDFLERIYNDEYARHDPDYLGKRPKEYALLISTAMPELRSFKVLDFGSGLGLLEKNLKELEFKDVDSYDPFTQTQKPQYQAYDVVLAFEVFEHHSNPHALIKEIKSYLKPDGTILFSTSLITKAIIDANLANWWYCVPRNGHITFYSPESLTLLAQHNQFQYIASLSPELHAIFNRPDLEWLTRHLQQSKSRHCEYYIL